MGTISDKDLEEAIMRVLGIAVIRDPITVTLEELRKIVDVIPSVTGDFPITSVCRDDLEPYGFDVDKISDDDMRELADRMEDDYCEQLFSTSMIIIAEVVLHFPKLSDREKEQE